MITQSVKSGFTWLRRFYLLPVLSFVLLFNIACQQHLLKKETVVVPPRVLKRPVLKYPHQASLKHQSGTVELMVLVNASGKVHNARISESSTYDILDKAAISYIKKVVFHPGEKGGMPAAMWISMRVEFSPQAYQDDDPYQYWGQTASITNDEMLQVYNFLKTPYDQGVVLRAKTKKQSVAFPKVFRYQDQWFMSFVLSSNEILETWLTSSDDLTQWEAGNAVLPKTPNSWDSDIKAGSVTLINPDLHAEPTPISYNGAYWMIYLGGNDKRSDKLTTGIGAAYAENFEMNTPWQRLENPVLDVETQNFQELVSHEASRFSIFHDKQLATGYPFILMSYVTDQLLFSGSNDLKTWCQLPEQPRLVKLPKQVSDLQLIRAEGLYVLVFNALNQSNQKEVRFACSKNLLNWKAWKGDALFTHSKDIRESCLLNHDDTIYHFYTMKENGNTSIALATSRPLD